MSTYFKTSQIELEEFNDNLITEKYSHGYVLTRLGKGVMDQTRSLRIDLSKFKLNSENKRILRKTEEIDFEFRNLPLDDYSWEIHRMGRDFYEKRSVKYKVQSTKYKDQEMRRQEVGVSDAEHFGAMSASKIKAMFNNPDEENMNGVFEYRASTREPESQRARELEQETGDGRQELGTTLSLRAERSGEKQSPVNGYIADRAQSPDHQSPLGYCLVYKNSEILHYAYPFYDLNYQNPNLGMGMMIRAIKWAKEQNLKYVYLGSVVTPESKYKLQFTGLEWFDTDKGLWLDELKELKDLL